MIGEGMKVTVSPDGSTKVEAVGYVGEACHDGTRAMENALGTVTLREPTEAAFGGEAEGEMIAEG